MVCDFCQLGFSPKRLQYTPRKPQQNATQFVKVTSVEESYKNVDTYCFTEPLKHKGVFNGILTGQLAHRDFKIMKGIYKICVRM